MNKVEAINKEYVDQVDDESLQEGSVQTAKKGSILILQEHWIH
jgi:hypothetical protein